MKDSNLNTTGTPDSQKDPPQQEMKATTNPTGGLSLFGVGGIRNKKKQEDRTNIIPGSSMESKMEKEQEDEGDNNAMTSGSADPVELQEGQMKLGKTKEARAEAAMKTAQNRKKRENKNKNKKESERRLATRHEGKDARIRGNKSNPRT